VELGVPVQGIRGSGPRGRIIERDIEEYAAAGHRMTPLAAEVAEETGKTAPFAGSGAGGRVLSSDLVKGGSVTAGDSTVRKLSNIRRIIAQNMLASLQNSAQLTHHMSADARAMLNIRKVVKKRVDEEGYQNITLNDMVCFAVIRALTKMPEINSHFLGDSIRTFNKVHLGIAVDTERGLMVPALRNADDYSIEELSARLKSLAESCKTGNIDPDLLAPTAASFTISNLGAFGVEMFTPVLNLPQSGILGVNTIIQRPGDTGGGVIGFIPYIGLSLTYDHRTIDGAPASAFLREVKEQIEKMSISQFVN
jgi:pyruvate dehydrogenase E2 component (dihydrolipoamide acetyltransferase)